MEPLFYFNEEAWEQYKKAIADGFKKALPYALFTLDNFAYLSELNKTEDLDTDTKTTLLRLHAGVSAAKYGINPDA